VRKAAVEMKSNGQVQQVSIEVLPVKSDAEERIFLVIFELARTVAPAEGRASISKDKLVKQLQDELNAAKDDMRAIIEEQEASNEELQSANEEIVSSNEELQSINEELETSKEEVESTNEELMTINTELQVRNEQLAEAYEYADAVFGTIREAVIVLDMNLRIKSANRSFYRIFQVNETETEGMLIYEVGNHQWDIPRLRELLEDIIPGNTQFHGFEVTHIFPHIGKKIMMLNARRIVQKVHRQQLLLVAIEDVTEHRQHALLATEKENWYRALTDNMPAMVWVSGTDRSFNFLNHPWEEFTGRVFDQEKGYDWTSSIHPEDVAGFTNVYHTAFNAAQPFAVTIRLKRFDGEYRTVQCMARPLYSPKGELTGYVGTCMEATGNSVN
jgi:two-component system CheB/CheR fusion protein